MRTASSATILAGAGSAAPVRSVFGVPMPQAAMPTGELLEGLL